MDLDGQLVVSDIASGRGKTVRGGNHLKNLFQSSEELEIRVEQALGKNITQERGMVG